jgi:hypothetical protein
VPARNPIAGDHPAGQFWTDVAPAIDGVEAAETRRVADFGARLDCAAREHRRHDSSPTRCAIGTLSVVPNCRQSVLSVMSVVFYFLPTRVRPLRLVFCTYRGGMKVLRKKRENH